MGRSPVAVAFRMANAGGDGDTANLTLVVPVLVISLWNAFRGSWIARLLVPGALFYVLYVAAIYLVVAR